MVNQSPVKNIEKLMLFFAFLTFLTSSMDIFLNIKIFGFSLRIVFILIIIQIIISLFYLIESSKKETIHFIGLRFMLIWTSFQIMFIPNTTILYRNIAYVIWLIFYLIFIPILPVFFRKYGLFLRLIKIYLLSFRVLAIWGIIQLVLGLLKINLLITQFWGNGVPRANGFSYEPSYYATYLLIGWMTCFVLVNYKNKLNPYLRTRSTFALTTLSIVLSSSRMGILFLVVIILGYIVSNSKDIFLRARIKRQVVTYTLGLSFILVSAFTYFSYNFDQARVYMRGLGLLGTVSHSTVVRTSDFQSTVDAFLESPIIGYSLGGIPAAIAQVRGFTITTQEETKTVDGVNIFAEVLAASGIIGFAFFMLFLLTFFLKIYKMSNVSMPIRPEYAQLMKALLWALFIELTILALNQNILRAYLWIHIAILNLGFFAGVSLLQEYRALQIDKK